MVSIVVTPDILFTRADVIPAVAEADAVFVFHVEPQSDVGAASREELGKGLVAAEDTFKNAQALCVINVGVSGTIGQADKGKTKLAVSGHPVTCLILAEGEVVFHQVH